MGAQEYVLESSGWGFRMSRRKRRELEALTTRYDEIFDDLAAEAEQEDPVPSSGSPESEVHDSDALARTVAAATEDMRKQVQNIAESVSSFVHASRAAMTETKEPEPSPSSTMQSFWPLVAHASKEQTIDILAALQDFDRATQVLQGFSPDANVRLLLGRIDMAATLARLVINEHIALTPADITDFLQLRARRVASFVDDLNSKVHPDDNDVADAVEHAAPQVEAFISGITKAIPSAVPLHQNSLRYFQHGTQTPTLDSWLVDTNAIIPLVSLWSGNHTFHGADLPAPKEDEPTILISPRKEDSAEN
jgi:hypothetical protein